MFSPFRKGGWGDLKELALNEAKGLPVFQSKTITHEGQVGKERKEFSFPSILSVAF